jgi:C4-type Zn-finger protein
MSETGEELAMIECPVCNKEGVKVTNPHMIEDEVVGTSAHCPKCKYDFKVTFSCEGAEVEG